MEKKKKAELSEEESSSEKSASVKTPITPDSDSIFSATSQKDAVHSTKNSSSNNQLLNLNLTPKLVLPEKLVSLQKLVSASEEQSESSTSDPLLHLVEVVEHKTLEAARTRLISAVTHSLETHVQPCKVALSAFLFEVQPPKVSRAQARPASFAPTQQPFSPAASPPPVVVKLSAST